MKLVGGTCLGLELLSSFQSKHAVQCQRITAGPEQSHEDVNKELGMGVVSADLELASERHPPRTFEYR